MNTKLSKENNLKKEWDHIFGFQDKSEEVEHAAQMLMFSFLSEIEKFQELQDVTRKKLSERICTSASYITQVFRGDKPLNFETIAKIQAALHITFHVHARPKGDEMVVNENVFLENTRCRYNTRDGAWYWKSFNNETKKEDKYDGGEDSPLINKVLKNYDDKAIPA
ncbi:MAG: helix-turn-helix transcriptional regulator [Chitinophagaceae bacterium]|nr:helix-turn-helix transcriptional regulator [Chitinophagaceae bacterium]